MVKRIAYCETCEREVELRRKNFNHKYHEILCLLIVSTISIGYFILKWSKKKNTCPYCETVFDVKNLNKKPEIET